MLKDNRIMYATCKECGKPKTPRRKPDLCKECREKSWLVKCVFCDHLTRRPPKREYTQPHYCADCIKAGKGELIWKPRRKLDKSGYIKVLVSPSGRWVDENGKEWKRQIIQNGLPYWQPEHRLVMEQILGRSLETGEIIHHKNGIRIDNSPSNLELCLKFQPHGQRVVDVIAYCKTLIKKYEHLTIK